jgi:uncharacterized protein (DUF169 family)
MTLNKKEMATLGKFGFDIPPVGVKYFVKRPDMVDRLDQDMALCQMLGWAQQGNTFYADPKNHTCSAVMR